MSCIAEHLQPAGMVLFNESFAATNEREGSQIARQIIRALRAAQVKVIVVTHLFDLTHSLYAGGHDDAMFVRTERQSDGRRTFKLHPGEPEPTSYGADLYRQVFGDDSASGPGANPAAD
jgi:DNA mismatch repair ATPase MutS